MPKRVTWTKLPQDQKDELCDYFVTVLGELKSETTLFNFMQMLWKNPEVASRYKEATGSCVCLCWFCFCLPPPPLTPAKTQVQGLENAGHRLARVQHAGAVHCELGDH